MFYDIVESLQSNTFEEYANQCLDPPFTCNHFHHAREIDACSLTWKNKITKPQTKVKWLKESKAVTSRIKFGLSQVNMIGLR